ncbi:RNA-binding protein 27-like [Anguilla anguilla]|uniref:RNA-binding protein 27-like n=1 Tax=Anguilla anguilla TaxID=7936 RepID=UPI0015AC9352|nr:RNA-binding protein 27-like [Anguilla anguilla]
MIVENVEALKSWLAKLLEPICEADPSALSSYVIALVKKDKPEEDLKALCKDQLDVFLQKETDSFVDKLFESLTTKSYLGTPVKEVLTKDTSKLYGGKYVGAEEEVGHVDVKRDGGRNRSPLRVHPDCNGSR